MAQTNPMPMGPWKVRQPMTDHSLCSERVCLDCFDCTFSRLWTDLTCVTDHRIRPGALPRQAYGVHCQLPEHHGVWDGEHPFSEG